MYTNNKLSKAVRLAIAFGAVSATAFTASVTAAEEEVAKVERIEVTGSRIKRTDLEGAVPVTVIDRAAIDFSGQTSVSDLIRNTSFNSSGSFRPQSGSSAQGISSVNLRGLGAERSLVLVDGRRLPKSPSTGNSQDLNSIPMAAVERIEILSDGASAVYGSDAIAGVINIITRKDFNGVEFRLGASEVSIPSEGGDREEGSVVFGSSSDNSSVIGGVSWNNRDIIFERHFPWVTPGASSFGVNYATADGPQKSIISAEECNAIPDFFHTGATNVCAYNFNASNANEASTGNTSGFLKAEYDINDDWKIFSHTLVSKTKSFGRYAPSLNDAGDAAFMSADSINNPTNPDSPFFDATNPDLADNREVQFRHRFAALGTRDNQVDNWSTDFLVGAEGMIGDVAIDFGARKSKSKTYEIGRNYLMSSNARAAIESGDYMLNDPFGTRFTDPADVSAYQTLLRSLKVTTARIGVFDQEEAFASASFDVFEMAAGTVQAVFGAEYRKETYADIYDSLSEAGQVGGSAGNSAGGSRNVKGAYFEALVPVMDGMELSFAGRFDKYSDYGSDFSPKVAIRYDIMDGMVFRASYGEGFRAPTLDILTQQPQPGNPSVIDEPTCAAFGQVPCPVSGVQVNALTIANPEISSESSKQLSLGLAYQPTDWLNFSADYYDIKITNLIRFFGVGTILQRNQTGQALPPGIGLTRTPQGGIDLVTQGYSNEGEWAISGLDFNVNTNFDFGGFGRLNQTLQLSHRLSNEIDGVRNQVSDPGEPRQRATFNNTYVWENLDFAWNVNYISSQYAELDVDDNDNVFRAGHFDSWVTHDVQVSYTLPTNTKISIGANNVFEKAPQLGTDPTFTRGYNFDLYDAYGRVMYLRVSQSF